MEIPRKVLDVFKHIVGESTLQDDPMDFRRLPYFETQKVKTDDLKPKR